MFSKKEENNKIAAQYSNIYALVCICRVMQTRIAVKKALSPLSLFPYIRMLQSSLVYVEVDRRKLLLYSDSLSFCLSLDKSMGGLKLARDNARGLCIQLLLMLYRLSTSAFLLVTLAYILRMNC